MRLAQERRGGENTRDDTCLKEKLMAAVPGLTAHTKGREVLLAFDEDIRPLIFYGFCEDNDADAMCLASAAKTVRKEISNETGTSMEHFFITAKENQYHRLC